jgi:tetratricopeptide (TPR) repeat protein
LSPASAVAAYELGDSYIQEHQWQQAADYLRRALTDPAVERKARLDLAKSEDELGKRSAAIEDLIVLAKDDPDGQVHYRLATVYRETGEASKAKAALAASEALRKASDQLSVERLEVLQKEAGSVQGSPAEPK